MTQMVLQLPDLPEAPIDAAAHFYSEHMAVVRKLLEGEIEALAIVFASVGKSHGWQIAAVRALAREVAPKRVNGVVGDGDDAIANATAWLANAPGITGQILAVDGKSGESG